MTTAFLSVHKLPLCVFANLLEDTGCRREVHLFFLSSYSGSKFMAVAEKHHVFNLGSLVSLGALLQHCLQTGQIDGKT